jgi:ABC-type Fe3+ transport system permease subunit
MSSIRARLILLAVLYLGFFSYLGLSGTGMPERVASHFNAAGEPDSWMSRSVHFKFMTVFGTAFPLAILVLCYLVRHLPDSLINIPHREYWLAAERRERSLQDLFRHSILLACLGVAFMAGVHFLVLQANTRSPVHLPISSLLVVTGGLIVGLLWWIVTMLRHFRAPDSGKSPGQRS